MDFLFRRYRDTFGSLRMWPGVFIFPIFAQKASMLSWAYEEEGHKKQSITDYRLAE